MSTHRGRLAGTIIALCLVGGLSHGAKAPHIPGVITEPTIFIAAEIQDISSVPIVIGKTIFDEFTPIATTLTLDLQQDLRGKVVGQGVFETTDPGGGATVAIKGKVKSSKSGPGFKLKGTAQGPANANGKSKKIKVSITAVMTAFESVDLKTLNVPNADPRSTATYYVAVQIKGLGQTYNYGQEIQNVANYHFAHQPAAAEDIIDLKDKPNSDYYLLITPWGAANAEGTFQLFGADGLFTLKASKFKFMAVDYGFDGVWFAPEYATLKTGSAKFEGPVESEGPPSNAPTVGSGRAVKSIFNR